MIKVITLALLIIQSDLSIISSIKPIAKYEDVTITSFDSYIECKIYEVLQLSTSANDCGDPETLYLYAFLYAMRTKFKTFVGLEDEISEIILKGSLPQISSEIFIKMGMDREEIQMRAISIYAFSERIRNLFMVAFPEFLEISRRYLREKRKLKIGKKSHTDEGERKILSEAERKVFSGMLDIIASGIEFID